MTAGNKTAYLKPLRKKATSVTVALATLFCSVYANPKNLEITGLFLIETEAIKLKTTLSVTT